MLAVELLLALQNSEIALAVLIAVALAAGLWIPYLYKEIRRGKAELGPRAPVGTGDTTRGGPSNPAPGQPDAQADPYQSGARR
jgi:hypothetical protein